MRICTPITIRYGETDMMGVVYHANYLLYFEDARTRFLEEIGYAYGKIEAAGFISPVVNLSVSYGSPLRYGDEPMIRTWISSSKPTRTVYSYEIFRSRDDVQSGKPCCTGYSTHCLVDAQTFKPVSIKRAVPELYARYEQVCEPDARA